MGINQYNKQQPQKEESDYDKVLKGLQVAGQLTGTFINFKDLENRKEERAAKAAKDTAEEERAKETFKLQQNADQRAQAKDLRDQQERESNAPLGRQKLQAEINRINAETTKAKRDLNTPNPDKEPKQNQFAAATYANRADQAETAMKALRESGFDRGSRSTSFWNAVVPKSFESQDYKKQDQAELNFLSAVLRKESGASISPNEREEGANQYFPRAGDGPEVLAQKEQNRLTAIAGLKAEGQPAMGRVQALNTQLPTQSSGGQSGSQDLQTAAQLELIRRRGLKAGIGPKGKK